VGQEKHIALWAYLSGGTTHFPIMLTAMPSPSA
jgi:hypothetical protein